MDEEILDIVDATIEENNEPEIDMTHTEETIIEESIQIDDIKEDSRIDNTTNCLALTVRENYHIVAVKNFFRKSTRVSWKVTLSIFVINFLNMFL